MKKGLSFWAYFRYKEDIQLWVISSAGEHLVYTETVGGSNPSSPTMDFLFTRNVRDFYVFNIPA